MGTEGPDAGGPSEKRVLYPTPAVGGAGVGSGAVVEVVVCATWCDDEDEDDDVFVC